MANLDSARIILTPQTAVEEDTFPDDSISDSEPGLPVRHHHAKPVISASMRTDLQTPSDWRLDYRLPGARPARHWICPFIYLPFLCAYAFLGAWMFTSIEAAARNGTNLTDHEDHNHNPSTHISDGMTYSVSVFTTVGYGNQAPKTVAGRILTICYAFLGIPLYFSFSADLQDWLDRAIFVWLNKLCFGSRFQRHRIARWKKCLVMLTISLAYLFLQGLITMLLENKYCDAAHTKCDAKTEHHWDYLTSIYFVFQSASLIGFGDLMTQPNHYLIAHLPMLIIGQVLLTGLFTAMIKYIRFKFPKWAGCVWTKLRRACCPTKAVARSSTRNGTGGRARITATKPSDSVMKI